MPAHVVTEVSCHLILDLRHSYDYMYSETSHFYYWGMNFAPIEVRYIFHLILSFSILLVCEFWLKINKITKTGAAGAIGTGTALIDTGTGSVLEGGIGTD